MAFFRHACGSTNASSPPGRVSAVSARCTARTDPSEIAVVERPRTVAAVNDIPRRPPSPGVGGTRRRRGRISDRFPGRGELANTREIVFEAAPVIGRDCARQVTVMRVLVRVFQENPVGDPAGERVAPPTRHPLGPPRPGPAQG
jgi:hypothetical protein